MIEGFNGGIGWVLKIIAALLALASPAAAASQIITWDPGGKLSDFIAKYSDMRLSGDKVVIDGICMSACTLALGLLPPEQVCATPYAVLGFHSASDLTEDGDASFSPTGTGIMWALYPEPVKALLRSRGWDGPLEHPILILVNGGDLFSMIRRCDDGDMAELKN